MNMIIFSSLDSLILYLLVFTIVALFLVLDKNKYRIKFSMLVIIALSILIFISTFRYSVGTDYFNYKRAMDSQQNINLLNYIQENGIIEIGNYFTNKLGNLFNEYNVVLAIRAMLTVITIYIAIWSHKEKLSISIAMFLFMCIYFPMSLNLSTQFIAICIVAISYKYIFEKNIMKFILTIFIASLFHTTALLVFPIYFLWNKNKDISISKVRIILSILLCIFIVKNIRVILENISEIDIFSSYSVYSTVNVNGNNRDIYLKILLFLIVFIFKDALIKHDNRNRLYILLILFNLIIGLSGSSSPWIKRMGLYFEITQIFILPGFIKILKNNKEKNLVGYTICMYAIGYFTLVYYILRQANVIPYRIMF